MLITPTNSDPSVNKPTTCRLDVQIKKKFSNLHFKELQLQYLLSKGDFMVKAV